MRCDGSGASQPARYRDRCHQRKEAHHLLFRAIYARTQDHGRTSALRALVAHGSR